MTPHSMTSCWGLVQAAIAVVSRWLQLPSYTQKISLYNIHPYHLAFIFFLSTFLQYCLCSWGSVIKVPFRVQCSIIYQFGSLWVSELNIIDSNILFNLSIKFMKVQRFIWENNHSFLIVSTIKIIISYIYWSFIVKYKYKECFYLWAFHPFS